MADRLSATYLIETRHPLVDAAASLAGEQSSGTFRALPGETEELLREFAARVEAIEEREDAPRPALPGASMPSGQSGGRLRRGEVTISWNAANTGVDLPTVWSTILGNLFELHHFSAIKLLDVRFPAMFGEHYPGPAMGVEGTRRAVGVFGRPLIGTIVKPSVGLSPEQTADLVSRLAAAGLDFVKDDELMGDPPHSPFADRLGLVLDVIERSADRTGRRMMYAANITGEMDDMLRRIELIQSRGHSCCMVVLGSAGLSAITTLRRRTGLAIHGHRAGWGMYDRSPDLGMSYTAYQKIWRLAGVDHLHVNGLRNKFCEPDESVIRSARACLTPIWENGRDDRAIPVFSSAQTAVQAGETFERLGSADLIYCCGGGIMTHPDGVEAGVASVREAWEAALAGIPAATFAVDRPHLAAALQTFGQGARP